MLHWYNTDIHLENTNKINLKQFEELRRLTESSLNPPKVTNKEVYKKDGDKERGKEDPKGNMYKVTCTTTKVCKDSETIIKKLEKRRDKKSYLLKIIRSTKR